MQKLIVKHTPFATAFAEVGARGCYMDNGFGFSLEKHGAVLVPDLPGKSRVVIYNDNDAGIRRYDSDDPKIMPTKEWALSKGHTVLPVQALLQLRLDYWYQPTGEQLIVYHNVEIAGATLVVMTNEDDVRWIYSFVPLGHKLPRGNYKYAFSE